MEKITGQINISPEILGIFKKENNMEKLRIKIEENKKEDTTKILSIILIGSVKLGASDIHLEPKEEGGALFRLRIDGILRDIMTIEPRVYKLLLSRIKLLSEMKLNITSKSQDGRFSILDNDKNIEIRSSILPSEYGESIVIRILDPDNLIEIEDLGIREEIISVFKKQIKQPNGMLILTGPTGSGKTTTLYAILKRIRSSEIKIITIEDPIEYHLQGISQTQVNPKKGYDFAGGLRSIVRQDPDVILVGEIRDAETANIALQASLTGHLVLTTLHTNDAAGTIVRLQALGAALANIAPAINIAIGQRLVRKVCPECAAFEKPSREDLEQIKKELVNINKKTEIPKIEKIPRARGCPKCNGAGYKGRTGIFEFFLNSPEMENFILEGPSISELRKKSREMGDLSLRQDGFIKVIKGDTTVEEINRVTKENI